MGTEIAPPTKPPDTLRKIVDDYIEAFFENIDWKDAEGRLH